MKIWQSIDWLLFLLILVIVIFSSAILISIGSFNLWQQLVYLFLAFFGFFVVSNLDYRIFRNFDLIFYFLSLILLLITFLFGRTARGATRWLDLGIISFQTSELVKPMIILAVANIGLRLNLRKFKDTLFYLLLTVPIVFFVFKQPDLGNTFIYLVIFLSIFFVSQGNWLFLLIGFLILAFSSPLIWQFLKDYQRERVISFLSPGSDPLGIGYNLIQAVVTIGSGRFLGRGLGIGTQSTLQFLPERATDFIFASLAEEIGFVGCLILLISLFLLLLRILMIAFNSEDNFGKNIALAVFAMIFFQTMINIGMNLGLLPITGVTLPLVSSGGSSLVATMISLGLVGSISLREKKFF